MSKDPSVPSDRGTGHFPYYDPDVCSRPIVMDGAQRDRINVAMCGLERMLVLSSYHICEARVLVCLVLYGGLTPNDIMDITGMRQSAVSNALSSLEGMGLIVRRVGKRPRVGRPYQFIQLAVPSSALLDDLGAMMESLGSDLVFVREGVGDGSRPRVRLYHRE